MGSSNLLKGEKQIKRTFHMKNQCVIDFDSEIEGVTKG